ncbi:MAG: phospholipase D family protein [Acinetobacter sp.]|nr:MAG: phospholipase D family protein [Acinetobacter sp.]
MTKIWFWRICVFCTICSLYACSTLPQRQPNIPTSYSTDIDTRDTYLASMFEPLKQQHPQLTGFHVLYDPHQALITRLQLINRAEKTLDLQYYIWENDKVGVLALEALVHAADRGVRVRLLIDDNNSKDLQSAYVALAQHPNIQIRVFNPYKFRKFRALDILLDFNRITRRMHNKTFIADHEVGLIGGRNMSNQYYNVGENFQFSDMDVVLVGQVVDDISQSFDEYWNHDYAYPIQHLMQHQAQRLSYQHLRQQLEQNWFKNNVEDYLSILSSSLSFDTWFNQNLSLQWVNAIVVKDSADKINRHTPQEQHLNFQLANILNHPEYSVDLVSAYFVPNDNDIDLMQQLTLQGTDIRVLTNSFQANDVPIVHAFYAKHRQTLLKHDIEIYEFLPILSTPTTFSEQIQHFTSRKNSDRSRSSLHAKFMALDNKQVFIGSFNFDQRSAYLNTEIGVVLDSPQLATAIHQNMNQNLLKYAYKVELDYHGKLIWKTQVNDELKIYHQEPDLKWWQKLGLKLITLLPIEKQM